MFKLAENGYTDIIIYVIITLVILISNAYKSYAKKKTIEKNRDNTAPEPRPIFPEVIFEPVFEYDEPEAEREVTFEKEEEILDSPQSKIDKVEPEIIPTPSYMEGEAAFKETTSTLGSEQLHIQTDIESEDLTSSKFFEEQKESEKSRYKFDVAQAVIYSEILKPKYF